MSFPPKYCDYKEKALEFFYFLERNLFTSAFQTWPNWALIPCGQLYNHRRKELAENIEVPQFNPFILQRHCVA